VYTSLLTDYQFQVKKKKTTRKRKFAERARIPAIQTCKLEDEVRGRHAVVRTSARISRLADGERDFLQAGQTGSERARGRELWFRQPQGYLGRVRRTVKNLIHLMYQVLGWFSVL